MDIFDGSVTSDTKSKPIYWPGGKGTVTVHGTLPTTLTMYSMGTPATEAEQLASASYDSFGVITAKVTNFEMGEGYLYFDVSGGSPSMTAKVDTVERGLQISEPQGSEAVV